MTGDLKKSVKVVFALAWTPGALRAVAGAIAALAAGVLFGWDWAAQYLPVLFPCLVLVFLTSTALSPVPLETVLPTVGVFAVAEDYVSPRARIQL